jgi:hypothetical protein
VGHLICYRQFTLQTKKHDGNDYPSDLYFDSDCWQSANLAAQQEVGFLSHKRDKPNYTDSPHSVLDWAFGAEVDHTPHTTHIQYQRSTVYTCRRARRSDERAGGSEEGKDQNSLGVLE